MTPPAVPEIDFDVESRMLRSIRRRFLWMSGVQMAIGVLTLIPIFTPIGTGERHSLGGWFTWGQSLLNLGLIVGAVVYVCRTRLDRPRLMRLIFALVVAGALIDVGGDRLGSLLLRLAPGRADEFLWEALLQTSARFFFAALFIRWSLREAMAIAGTLLGITLAVAATYVAHPTGRSSVVKLVLFSPLWYLPGLLICWFTHSRLVARFRAQFESTQYRRLRSELTSARKLHESVLPAQVADGPFHLSYQYEPMREIGGDLVHLRRGEPAETAPTTMIVLDVTGHGIAAALTVNRLVGEIERLFGEDAAVSPRQVIRALDRYISLTLAHHEIFATACCARFTCGSNRLEWCSGGHPPAFICRGDGSLERLDSTAPMLGADCETSDDDQLNPRFEPGDVLVCYTDGAIEASNPKGEMLGIDGLARMVAGCASGRLPPRDWPAVVLTGVQRHRGAPPEDDTLIAVLHCPACA